MRRLALLCLACCAAVSGYNLAIQEIKLTGGRILSNEINCDNIDSLHIGGPSYSYDCYDVYAIDDKTKLEARKLAYLGAPITSKNKDFWCDITLKDQSKISFKFTPQMKVGQVHTDTDTGGSYQPITTPTVPTTTSVPTTSVPVTTPPPTCNDDGKSGPDGCVCKDTTKQGPACTDPIAPPAGNAVIHAAKRILLPSAILDCGALVNKGKTGCEEYCKDEQNVHRPACVPASPPIARARATKKLLPRVQSDEESAVMLDATVPAAIRIRGPGPARPPFHDWNGDTVVSEESQEQLRVKRDDAGVDSTTIFVAVTYYVLDEAGNPAAVWAAVIEGIILLLLVGACFYFFFWAPRARAVKAAAADPYKEEGPNYSVSYANSSYNQNQRIDAFQNPPAAPARPANSAYMDDYITDNIGAMSRPSATTTQPMSAAANSSAFQPTHQRYDSSGLVTVNLS